MSICELLPRSAQVADKLCILRAMTTGDNIHGSSGYYMMTGTPHQPPNIENISPGAPNDAPNLGAVVGRLSPKREGLPAAVTLPQRIVNTGGFTWFGQDAGYLGRAGDPWLVNARWADQGYRIQDVDLPADLDLERLGRRRDLLGRVQERLDMIEHSAPTTLFDSQSRQALDLLQASAGRGAFRIDREPPAIQELYGKTPFGQAVLLARRLVESGVRLTQVNWYRGPDEPSVNPVWDSHVAEAPRLKNALTPSFDRAYSALLIDLEQRGLLDETLVVCMAEFGRSPQLDNAGGRGHWGSVFSIVLAGGGIRGGQVYGASDRMGGHPRDGRTRPEDLAATIFHCLGHDPDTEVFDRLARPHPISRGEVIQAIL
jgi:hypothetical protein